ncbi:MAG TPA: ATP-binding protein [Amycolatopsis sp.]|nr:ATP-binding protein [Amycolatopsis sp.]
MTDPDEAFRALDLRGTDAGTLARIRGWARRALEDLAPGHRGDVLMVLDELASNAYEHTAGPTSARLTTRRHPCQVEIEVDDPVHDHPVTPPPGTSGLRGRGMQLVDYLSDAWGVRDRPTGKTVWARLDCSAGQRDPCTDDTRGDPESAHRSASPPSSPFRTGSVNTARARRTPDQEGETGQAFET